MCGNVALIEKWRKILFAAAFHNIYIAKAQGASIRTERKPFEPERFSELGRTRIGLERSGCTEM